MNLLPWKPNYVLRKCVFAGNSYNGFKIVHPGLYLMVLQRYDAEQKKTDCYSLPPSFYLSLRHIDARRRSCSDKGD